MLEAFIGALVPFFEDLWPYFAYALIISIFSEFFEKIVIPLWDGSKYGIWPRRLQSIFPIVLGGLLGVFIPTSLTDAPQRCLAFAGSGAVGVMLFDIIRAWLDKRGIKINLPGIDDKNTPP